MFHDNEHDNLQEPIHNPYEQQPTASGSYYSPRSGDAVPPVAEHDPASVTPKRSSLKVVKALGIFAGIAFLSFASIQCYQFAVENASLKKFFGKEESVASSTETTESNGKKENEDKVDHSGTAKPNENQTDSVITQDWIELAARKDALSIPDIVDKVTPSTVGVSSTFVWEERYNDMWGFGSPSTYERSAPATGTGIIMSTEGYVLTNAHVIFDEQYGGAAKEIQIVLNEDYYEGETQIAAKIVGYDTEEDIAVLKMNTNQQLKAAEFGDSDALRVGELVIAIGNPLGLDLFGSVTTGIVSALDREVTINEVTMSLIQTDTAINSGNSGGPLINSYGQVIGINSLKMHSSYSETTIEGLGFAIPMAHAKKVVDDLINYGYVRGKPVIGITGRDVSEAISQAYGLPMGVYVTELTDGGAAALAGVKVGDIIIAVNGESVSNYDELNAAKNAFKAGDTITITVVRNGQDHDCQLTLQEKKPELAQ